MKRRFSWPLAGVLLLACITLPTPPLSPGANTEVGGTGASLGTEVSVDYVYPFYSGSPNNPDFGLDRLIYQFNPGGAQGFAWSWTDGATGWHTCNANTPGPCFVQKASGQSAWVGDPVIASAPLEWVNSSPSGAGVVLASSLGNDTNGKLDMVVISVSLDGGTTFSQGINVAGAGDCPGGIVDQPDIAFDPSAPGTFYAVWRYDGGDVSLGATFGACIQGGQILFPGNFPPGGPPPGFNLTCFSTGGSFACLHLFNGPYEIQNLDRSPGHGVGGMIVQPLSEGLLKGIGPSNSVTVMYNNTDDFHEDCSGPYEMRWFSVSTGDDGFSWSSSHQVLDANGYMPCTPGNRYIKATRGTFAFKRDSTGTLWAAVNDTENTAQIFNSSNEGSSWGFDATAFFPGIYQPVLSADRDGGVALWFYGATNATGGGLGSTTTPLIMARSPKFPVPNVWTEPQEAVTPVGSGTFPSVVLSACTTDCGPPGTGCPGLFGGQNCGHCVGGQCVGTRGLGDYQGMTFVPTGLDLLKPSSQDSNKQYVPAWSTQLGQVDTSLVEVEYP